MPLIALQTASSALKRRFKALQNHKALGLSRLPWKALLDKIPHPTDTQIRESMNGTLCRCMSYFRVQNAIKRAMKTIADASPADEKEVVA